MRSTRLLRCAQHVKHTDLQMSEVRPTCQTRRPTDVTRYVQTRTKHIKRNLWKERPIDVKRDHKKRPTRETYKEDLQKRPTKKTYRRDLQKRPTKEIYKRDLQKRPTRETYKRDQQKRLTKETYKRDLHKWRTKMTHLLACAQYDSWGAPNMLNTKRPINTKRDFKKDLHAHTHELHNHTHEFHTHTHELSSHEV